MKTCRTCERCKVARPLSDYARTTFGYYRRTCEFCRGKKSKKKATQPREPTTPIVGGKRRCRTCEKIFPSTSFRKMPDRYGTLKTVRVSVCRSCDKAASIAARKRRSERDRALIAARKSKACTCCGKEKPLDEEHFYRYWDKRRRTHRFHSKCRTCIKIWLREYIQTPKGRAALRRYRRSKSGRSAASRNNKSQAGRARSLRYYLNIKKEDKSARNKLRRAIGSGKVAVPKRCRCGSKRLLRAWFNCGHGFPLDVTFCCYVCWARRKAKRDALMNGNEPDDDGEGSSPIARFTCTKLGWEAIHRKNVEALEREEAEVAKVESEGGLIAERRAFLTRLYLDEGMRTELVEALLEKEGWFFGSPPMELVLGVWGRVETR